MAYANGPSGAPAAAPMMNPSIMPEDMAGAMDSGPNADSSGSGYGSGCAPKPVPTQYEAFENVRFFRLELDLVLIVLAYMAYPDGCCHDSFGCICVVALAKLSIAVITIERWHDTWCANFA